jgi:sugar lactone lactonase YvrE
MAQTKVERTHDTGEKARRNQRVAGFLIIIAGLAPLVGLGVFLLRQAEATGHSMGAMWPSKPMQGCLVLLAGTVGTNFHIPTGMAVDAAGNLIVADSYNNVIRKISGNGSVTTLAGSGEEGFTNGTVTTASFRQPTGIAVGLHGEIYVADTPNHVIRKIDAGVVSTFAGNGEFASKDGNARQASFYFPGGIAVDHQGNVLVSDSRGGTIRAISPNGAVTTIAGSGVGGFTDGVGKAAKFNSPDGIAVDSDGSILHRR